MVLASAAVDGVTNIVAGWTDQALTPYSSGLESSGGGTLGIASNPAANGYLAWSMIPEDAIATNSHTSGSAFLTRITAQTGGPCGHIDLVMVSGNAVTNAVFGIYNSASFAVGPLAWTANVSATITGAAGLYSLTWNGASSPASVNLQAGATYWIYSEITGTTPTQAGSAGANAAAMNANLTASATQGQNSESIVTAPYTTLTAASTLAPQTTWAASATKMWFGLKA